MIDCHNQDSPEDDNASSCSESTTGAFFEMLGLPVMDFGTISSAVDDDVDADYKGPLQLIGSDLISASRINHEHKQPSVSFLQVPQRCSRYFHKPPTIASFVIENLLTSSECQSIICLAEELSVSGFHYVTEASHTDNEGKCAILVLCPSWLNIIFASLFFYVLSHSRKNPHRSSSGAQHT